MGLILALLILIAGRPARADEGMWLLTDPPRDLVRATYGFELADDWLLHVQRSCVRMEASGAFVSPDGLLMTNHHVGIDWISQLDAERPGLVESGFYAANPREELRCPGLEVQILDSVVDVTAQIKGELPPGSGEAKAHDFRQGRMARLEQEEGAASGLDCEVVVLDRGARYHLYRYRRYDDVRLVFAPEEQIANFGGDVDNFEYPRYAFDLCFFRVYENGEPLRVDDWLPWSADGAKEGELVFAVGHPYQTGRHLTLEEIRLERDVRVPWQLQSAVRREVQLLVFSARSPDNAEAAVAELLGVQNWRKAQAGVLVSLQDPAVMHSIREREEGLRNWMAAVPEGDAHWNDAWDQIALAVGEERRLFPQERIFGHLGRAFGSRLFRHALTLVELSSELSRPNEERMRRYRSSELESVYLQLYKSEPIHDGYEIDAMAGGLSLCAELLGGEDPLVVALLDGASPRSRATALVQGCTLRDPAIRRELAGRGRDGIEQSRDPMIRLARVLAPEARRVDREHEEKVEGPREAGHALLAAARLARGGHALPPDATGTLRLSYGTVRGYQEAGQSVPAFTDFDGLYARSTEHGGREPFDLPARWIERRDRIDGATPLNFVQTLDTVGGSSGSPILNVRGEIVGLLFDGNLQTLIWDYAWVDDQARSVGVDSRGIIQALREIYDATPLVDELTRER